jgi:asparagine synthase (glutamine-hydrolysing)
LRRLIVHAQVSDLEGLLRRVVYHLEEPIANINALTTYILASAIREHGYKVVLMGEGGDELFAGYPWYAYCFDATHSQNAATLFAAYRRRRGLSGFGKFLRSDMNAIIKNRIHQQSEIFIKHFESLNTTCLNRFLAFDQIYQLQFSQLHRVDRMMMAHGVEARVPFLYQPVLDLSAELPDKEKINGGPASVGKRQEKIALGSAFEALLPPKVANRPKFGEAGTVNLWNTSLVSQLNDLFIRSINSPTLACARDMLDPFMDWGRLRNEVLMAKDKLSILLYLFAADIHILKNLPSLEVNPVQVKVL